MMCMTCVLLYGKISIEKFNWFFNTLVNLEVLEIEIVFKSFVLFFN